MTASNLGINNVLCRYNYHKKHWVFTLFAMLGCFILNAQILTPSFTVNGLPHSSIINICQNVPIVFSDATNGFVQNVNWSFSSGTPSSSTSSTVSVVFSSLGSFPSSLSVTDSLGGTSTYNFMVVVGNTIPNATFTLNDTICQTTGKFPLYGGMPAGGYYIGAGVTNNEIDPQLLNVGNNTVGYVYYNSTGCSDTAYSNLYVLPAPSAGLFETNSFSNCNSYSSSNPNFLVTVFDMTTSTNTIVKHEIIWGDGTTNWDSTSFNNTIGVSHIYLGQGIYSLSYIVTDINGCSDTATYSVLNTLNPASLNVLNPGGTNGCAPATFAFPLTTSNTDSSVIYTIDWGDNSDTTFKHPPPAYVTHTYDTTSCVLPGGFFNITATSTNACLSTQSTTAGPFITQPAIAEFDSVSGCVNKMHSLPNQSVPGFANACSRLTTFIWDFGDGSPPVTISSLAPVPPSGQHIWTSPGFYDVQLIVESPSSAACPNDTINHWVCIEDSARPALSFSDTINCAPFDLTIVNNSDTTSFCSKTTFSWMLNDTTGVRFKDSTDLNSFIPKIEFTKPGIFLLTFNIQNNCYSKDVTQKIVVKDVPELQLPANQVIYCDTLTVNFQTDPNHAVILDSNHSNILSYSWKITPPNFSFVNGTSSSSRYPEVSFSTDSFTIVFEVINECGLARDTQIVVVNPEIISGFSVDTYSGCSPLTVSAQSTGDTTILHEWFIGGVLQTNSTSTSFTFTNYGANDSLVEIVLAVTSGLGCTDTLKDYVLVHPQPDVSFAYNPNCLGFITQFWDSTFTGLRPVISRTWDFGDGNTDTARNPIHIFANSGYHWVGLTVVDSGGCTTTWFDSVLVTHNPVANFDPVYSTMSDSACIGQNIPLLDSSIIPLFGDSIVTWMWDFYNDGTIDDTLKNSSIQFSAAGSFPVKLVIIGQQGCKDSITKLIHVAKPPVSNFSLSSYSGCTPLTVIVNDSSVGNISQYEWTFYNYDTSGVKNIYYTANNANPNPVPSFAYSGNSSYKVFAELKVSNNCYTSVMTDTIRLKPIPIPYFIVDVDTGCSPLTSNIQTDGILTGHPDSILFDFGDGTPTQWLKPIISLLPNGDTLYTWNQVQHTFTYNGNSADTTYYIKLRGVNYCGDSTFTSSVTVKSSYVQSFFSANLHEGCAPLTVSFTDQSYNAFSVNYSFDFDTLTGAHNGVVSSATNPVHTFTQPGTYVVAQTASNSCGGTMSYQVFNVFDVPNIQVSLPQSICIGDTLHIVNNSYTTHSQIASYVWDFGNGDSTYIHNPSYIYNLPGTYSICLTASTIEGCDTTWCTNVVVNEQPKADFMLSDSVCLNQQPIFFSNTSSSVSTITKFNWDFGDGDSSSSASPSHNYEFAGIYTVKLRIENALGCSDSIQKTITVLHKPEVEFAYAHQFQDSCGAPSTIQFTSITTATQVFWDFDYKNNPGLNTSTVVHPTFTYTAPGSYDVLMLGYNQAGCKDSMIQTVNIHSDVIADFEVDTAIGCAPLIVNFTNKSFAETSPSDSLTYYWDFGDGQFSTDKNPTHVYLNSGFYNVTLRVTSIHGCTAEITYSNLIEVLELPFVSFVYTKLQYGEYQFTMTSSNGLPPYLYAWDFGDNTGSTSLNPIHEFEMNRINFNGLGYEVCLTVIDANGCDSTYCDSVILGDFTLYVPNAMSPSAEADAQVFLPKGQGLETYECQIFDRWGNLIWRSTELDPEYSSPKEGWDGTKNGVPMPMGVYVWRIDATFENGDIWNRYDEHGNLMGNTGTITLLR